MNQEFRKFEKVLEILKKYDHNKNNLIAILHRVQEEYRYLPEDVLTYVAAALEIPPAEVYGVATFYAHYTLVPKGKYVIKVCDGTACHVKGSIPIYDEIKKKLGLSENEDTTKDLLFTVETVSCLGACGLAPVMLVNEDVYGGLTPDKIGGIIDKIMEKEESK